jgi:hypothetical protein
VPDFTLSLTNAARRPSYPRATSSAIPLHTRRSSAPITPEARNMGDYFINPAEGRDVDEQRRRSSTSAMFSAFRRPSVARVVMDALYPADDTLIEPFSFVSTKTSPWPFIKLGLGMCGMIGYQMGGILLVDSLFQIAGPAGTSQGVGSAPLPSPGPMSGPSGPDGLLPYATPPVAVGAIVFAVGIACGLTSTFLFLKDGLKIAGNRRKAFCYATMHVAGIALISSSKFIVTFQKNRIPIHDYIALSLPSGIGRGLHWITIPRSFSNSELVNSDCMRATFEQRLMLSELFRFTAAVFFGLWAASWSEQNYDPLTREVWGILASVFINISVALPNTNLKRADIFRRSQTSLLSPQLNAFRIGGAVSPLVSPSLPGLPLVSPDLTRPALKESLTYPMQSLPKAVPTGILRGHGTGSVAMSPTGSSSREGILASMPMSRSYSSYASRAPSSYMMNRQHSGVASIESRFTETLDPLQKDDS